MVAPVALVLAILLGGLTPSPRDPNQEQGISARQVERWLGMAVGWESIVVGVAGLLIHLESQFFASQTIKNLVYTAPFVAPLAYGGSGSCFS